MGKEFMLANILRSWTSLSSYIRYDVFGAEAKRNQKGGKRSADVLPDGAKPTLQEQKFPYQLPEGTRHYVLWLPGGLEKWPDDSITKALLEDVAKLGGKDFVWYHNPKPSVTAQDLAHVQTFVRL